MYLTPINKLQWISAILLFTLSFSVMSGPAFKGLIDFKQPDGSTFQGSLKGDEWFSWIEDSQGNIVKYNNSTKRFEYSELSENNGEFDLQHSGIAVQKPVQSNQKSTANINPKYHIDQNTLKQIWQTKRHNALEKVHGHFHNTPHDHH